MPLIASRPTVGTSATLLSTSVQVSVGDVKTVVVQVPSGAANSIYVGGSGVTTSTGMEIVAGSSLSIDLGPGDDLYAVAAANTTVQLLLTRS